MARILTGNGPGSVLPGPFQLPGSGAYWCAELSFDMLPVAELSAVTPPVPVPVEPVVELEPWFQLEVSELLVPVLLVPVLGLIVVSVPTPVLGLVELLGLVLLLGFEVLVES